MPEFDLAWFMAGIYGAKYQTLTQAQFDFIFPLAESELSDVKCWCPKLYPTALTLKLSLLLDGMQLGGAGASPSAPPSVAPAGGNYEAYVQEDEVFDVRRKYKIVEKDAQIKGSTTPAQLEAIIIKCKPPLRVGAMLAAGVNSMTGGCCGARGDLIGDKAEWNHGGQ